MHNAATGASVYYKHSGRFSIGGVAISLLAGCAAALVLGYAYGRGSIYVDDERFAFLLTIAFGAFLGLLDGYGSVLGKLRNQRVNLCVLAASSLLALYVSWSAWIATVLQKFQVETAGWLEYAQNPRILWRAIVYINQYGTWSLGKGDATKGAALWTVWIVEAAMVIGIAMFTGYACLHHYAFCERCDSWCRSGAKFILSVPPNPASLKRQLETNDWRSLESLTAGNRNTSHLLVELVGCERCRQLHTLTLTYTSITRDKLRRPRISKTKIVEHVIVGLAQAENLKQLSTRVEQASKLAPAKSSSAKAGS